MNLSDGVPVLATLVADKATEVRLASAYALARMTNAAALDAYGTALEQDYGRDRDHLRTPEVTAHLVRVAARQFVRDRRTRALLDQAAKSDVPTVKFLALVAGR
jgi:hypothetical protein